MSRSLQTRTKNYPSLGKCIICLGANVGGPLTDEHIIPFALNGNFVFLEATCEVCAKYGNKEFEQPALNADLLLPRLLLELRRRGGKKKRDKTVLRPMPGGWVGSSSELEKVRFDINTFPKLFPLVVFQRAGRISGLDLGSTLSALRVCHV